MIKDKKTPVETTGEDTKPKKEKKIVTVVKEPGKVTTHYSDGTEEVVTS